MRIVDIEALYTTLDAKRRNKNLSWRELAIEVGVSASTLTRMTQGASPDVEGFAKMVLWLGVSADDFIAHKKRRPAHMANEFLVVVARHLCASNEFGPRSTNALIGIIEAAYRHLKQVAPLR